MSYLFSKYKYIFLIILIVAISAMILINRYNKLTSSDCLLSFEITGDIPAKKSEELATVNLLLTPSAGNFYIGDNISLSLLVSSINSSINMAEGIISFPTDKLEVTNLSKTGSIFNLWIQEPSFSNQDGTITFMGGLPTPGFIGLTGHIITITFKVIGSGDAVLNVSKARILANDGIGTDILTDASPSQLKLLKPKTKREISDINEDGKIDLVDLSILISNWGVPKNTRTDLNGDGTVDAKDISILLSKWTIK